VYEYRARVLRLVDGDTYHLELDLGLEVTVRTAVRLIGANTPERGTSEASAATAAAGAWLRDHADRDGWSRVRTVKDKREKYGRYLVDVHPWGDDTAPSLAS